MLVCILTTLCLLSGAHGHNWMELPTSRNGNRDSTSQACPTGTDPNTPNVLVELDYPFNVAWTTNHDGNHFVKISTLSAEANIESMVTVSTEDAPTDLIYYEEFAVDVPDTTVTFSDVLPGMYLLQYGWSNYRNCVTIQVAAVGDAPEPVGLDGTPGTISTEELVDCNSMCSDFENWCEGVTVDDPYADRDDCLQKCASFPVGVEGDLTGNTLHCRWHHLHVEGGDPSVHCVHASYNNTECAPGAYLPSVTVTVSSEEHTAEDIQAEIEASLEAEGYEDVTVFVTETTSTSEFVVVTQFSASEAGEEAATALITEGAFETVLEGTTLALEEVNVLGEVEVVVSTALGAGADTGVNSNIIAAAVLLPTLVIAVTVGCFMFRTKLDELLPGGDVEAKTLRIASGVQHLLTFLVLTVCIASGSWAVDNNVNTTFGLFKYCHTGLCIPMSDIDPAAAAAIQGAQAMALLALICSVASMGVIAAVEIKGMGLNTLLSALSALGGLCYFFAICLYSAYFYDILSVFPDMTLGWSLDLFGAWWLVSFMGTLLDYRIHASDSPTAKHAPSA